MRSAAAKRRETEMREVGRIVGYVPTNWKNSRNSEGCFIRRKDGAILYAWSNYHSGGDDDSPCEIGCLVSRDEGETWGERFFLYHNSGRDNIMCPSLMRMHNGDMGLFFIHRNAAERTGCDFLEVAQTWFVRSSDEGETWSEPIVITPPDLYFVFENGHAVMLKSGRILVPVAFHGGRPFKGHASTAYFMSDDDGRTWYEADKRYEGVPEPWSDSGLQEPMSFETTDGVIRTFSRTDLFYQYESDSFDDGKTWTKPMPNRGFSSPCAPMMIKPVGDLYVALFNPVPKFVTRVREVDDERSPLIALVSRDGGKTFPWDDPLIIDWRGHSAYPDLFDGGDYMLAGYQADPNDGVIKKIRYGELIDPRVYPFD